MCAVTKSCPTVSVIIPTHNRCEMLKVAVQSVLDQTFEDLETIIIDDASTDKTSEIIEHFHDDRIRYLRNDENKGGSASRNTGISIAQGSYIGFLDDDDEWLPTKLKQQIDRFEKRPDIDVVACGFLVRDANTDRILYRVSPRNSGHIFNDLLWSNTIGTPTVLIKREFLGEKILFDDDLPRLQDWDLWLRLAKDSIFDCMEEPMVIVNFHDNARISTDQASSLVAWTRILEKYWDDIKINKALLSNHYLRIGSANFQLNNMKEGRQLVRKSIAANPLNLNSMIALVFSHLGSNIYCHSLEKRRKLATAYRRFKYHIDNNNNA